MKLSDRDLKLLVILLLAVVIVCPILFVLRPLNEKIEATNTHIDSLKERQDFLAKLNANRQFYLDSIELLNTERGKIIANYAEGLRDENTVMFLADAEKQLPIAMKTLSFITSEPMVISESSVDENGELVEGLQAYTSYSTVEYVAQYDAFKEFLAFILNNDTKMVVTSISANQNDENGSIEGVFVLNQYAVTGEGRELEQAKIPAMDHGRDNIFGVPEGISEEDLAALEEGAGEGAGEAATE